MDAKSSNQLTEFPQPPAIFDATEEALLQDTHKLIDEARSVHDSIASQVTPKTATFTNTLLPIAQEESRRLYWGQKSELYQHVSTDDKVRDASRKAQQLFADLAQHETEPERGGEVERGECHAEHLQRLDGLEDVPVELDDGREDERHGG